MERLKKSQSTFPIFSIILPVYDQKQDIERILNEYPGKLNELNVSWELLLIVNGSKDGSYSLARKLIIEYENVRVYELNTPGWGSAVKHGISKSKGQFICYTNSARTNCNDLILILNYALVNDNIVIKANRIIRDSLIRKLGSVIFNLEFRFIFKIPVWDINGTPKVISSAILKDLNLQENGDLIDAELMLKCVKRKIQFIEVPVINTKRFSGKSTTGLISAIKMYFGLFSLKNDS